MKKKKGKKEKETESTFSILVIDLESDLGIHKEEDGSFIVGEYHVTLIKPENQLNLSEEEKQETKIVKLSTTKRNVLEDIFYFDNKSETYLERDMTQVNQLHTLSYSPSYVKIKQEPDENTIKLSDTPTVHKEPENENNYGIDLEKLSDEDLKLYFGIDRNDQNSKENNNSNQSFLEKSTETLKRVPRLNEVQTDDIKKVACGTQVSQWIMHQDIQEQEREKAVQASLFNQRRVRKHGITSETMLTSGGLEYGQEVSIFDIVSCEKKTQKKPVKRDVLKRLCIIMERNLIQNIDKEIYMDLKFWDDPSDKHKQSQGSLLPLFQFNGTEEVMCVSVNSFIPHIFAVGYGSFNYQTNLGLGIEPPQGGIRIFSIKNPKAAEKTIPTSHSVLCLSFNDNDISKSGILAAGFFDGSLAIYNVSMGTISPLLTSKRHYGCVVALHWLKDEMNFDEEQSLYTLGEDGRLLHWVVGAELSCDIIMEFKIKLDILTNDIDLKTHKVNLFGKAQPTCMDFNPLNEFLFLVGTEDGKIYKCSRSYNNQYLHVYDAHMFAVYSVKFNPVNPQYFVTASADWTLKVFDDKEKTEIFVVDLSVQVASACFSSTSDMKVFAIDYSGRVSVYDLNGSGANPICQQRIVHDSYLTTMHLAKKEPVIFVGDDEGLIHMLKLSPNLR